MKKMKQRTSTLPKKSEIFLHWKKYLDEKRWDFVVPHCWACGWSWMEIPVERIEGYSFDELKSLYDKENHLQRCHIIADSLHGGNDVSNLFLMCRECHDLAPNTTSKEFFLKWVEHQSWFSRKASEILDGIKTFEIKDEDHAEITEILGSDEFKRWYLENTSLHRLQNGSGIKMTSSTLFAAVKAYQKMKNE